ncbi:hypothetical protein tloyanaT_26230 [Thalassotalea loyana]|uniref:Mu-like prophage FluMu N-terminal domain-containing protein n=1 Tax=Thalassotalea loyana TaxID=280483 RepID=A0ABQ6HE25_9GAMM|nr:HI1506-related protein [Thalassotalea loyana]GLX86370.1 hypothetical protein tloyanaT_26230 [Thalassotalea loyana]
MTQILIFICVLSAMHNGYRRAGFDLKKGKNELEVTQAQFEQLDADPNLSVSKLDNDAIKDNRDSQGGGPSGLSPDDIVMVDLEKAPANLAPFIASIIALAGEGGSMAKRPSCKELAVEVDVDGKLEAITPSKEDADAAFAWYQENVVSKQGNS